MLIDRGVRRVGDGQACAGAIWDEFETDYH